MSPKQEAQASHTIAACLYLLSVTMDKFEPKFVIGKQIKEKAEEIMPLADTLIEEIYGLEQIRSSTYITDIVNKVETVIRKNFQEIK